MTRTPTSRMASRTLTFTGTDMNHTKQKPAGIDIPIQAFQSFFYAQMLKKFGITDDKAFDLYGRAHNNTKTSGSVAEVLRANGEYMDVLFNDTLPVGQGFFAVGDRTSYAKGSGITPVALILQYTMTGITRGPYSPMHDEQVNATIMDICRQPRFGF